MRSHHSLTVRFALAAAFVLSTATLLAQSHPFDRCCDPALSPTLKPGERDWVTGTGVSLGGVLFPHFHFESIYGGSTADPETLAVGHHDPDRQGLTISNIDFGASLRTGQHLEAFVAYAAKVDLDDD